MKSRKWATMSNTPTKELILPSVVLVMPIESKFGTINLYQTSAETVFCLEKHNDRCHTPVKLCCRKDIWKPESPVHMARNESKTFKIKPWSERKVNGLRPIQAMIENFKKKVNDEVRTLNPGPNHAG